MRGVHFVIEPGTVPTFRDPLAVKSTNLSHALEMTYVP